MAILEARRLSKDYGSTRALERLDLSIGAGEIFALLGANGAGKSTTIKLFLGFLEPTEGQAMVDDVEVARDPLGARRRLAYVPENVSLYPTLSGVENLEYFAALGGRADLDRAELLAALEHVGLERSAAQRRVSTYSKGMRQKVGIAIAAAKDARAILLDEPTSGLDPAASNEFGRLIRTLANDGCAVLMVTHDLFRARECSDRLGIMRRGRLMREVRANAVGARELEEIYLATVSEQVERGLEVVS